ncbi:MAG TPA: hypothetical protein PKD34_02810, partial [Candidatus Doudnabacteria bacterium]|nr:hypothetical protein [Candidatus Doudnabacteria bacterium]
MTTLSNESASTKIKSKLVSKPGFAEATMLLRKITEGVQRITAEQRFPLTPRNKMYKYPHLKQRMIEFQEYNTELPMALFHRNWCKHIGGIVVPWNRVNGNIHLYLMDD